MTSRASVASVEYLRLPIVSERDGAVNDPTGSAVEIAIVPVGTVPESTEWEPAEWEAVGPPYIVRKLIGPGSDFALTAGRWDVYVRIDDAPEMPAILVDELVVYGVAPTRLVTPGELGDLLGIRVDPEDARANLACALATGSIQSETRQTLVYVEDDVYITSRAYGRRISLPERPVVAVSAVSVGGAPLVSGSSYLWDGGAEVTFGYAELGVFEPGQVVAGDVSVTYSHGLEVIPDDLKGVALARAARIFQNPAGVTSQAVMGASVSYASPLDAILVDEPKILARYKLTARSFAT